MLSFRDIPFDSMCIDERTFRDLGMSMAGRVTGLPTMTSIRKFTALFGLSPKCCCAVWIRLGEKKPRNGQPVHMLWALLLLKVYATEDVLCAITRVDRKTVRKWAWQLISAISYINEVSRFSMWFCTLC